MEPHAPLLGPIVGHTTPHSVTLWARGPTGSVGVVRYREVDGEFGLPAAFAIDAENDHTGVVILNGLDGGREYDYQLGFVPAGNNPRGLMERIESGEAAVEWANPQPPGYAFPHTHRFRTFPEADTTTTFIFGSCRHLGFWLFPRGDEAFKTIHQRRESDGEESDFILMAGDQIYADLPQSKVAATMRAKLGLFKPPATLEGYWFEYQKAFGTPFFRRVPQSTPTYMVMDDHEVVNDWGGDEVPKRVKGLSPEAYRQVRDCALSAYRDYQVSHGPAAGTGRYWYCFDHGPSRFFVMDVRSERDRANHRQIGTRQMEALTAWLEEEDERVSFIVSPVPMFPDTTPGTGAPEDKWTGFPAQRLEILERIKARAERLGRNRTVVLSGDVHCSFIAELTDVGDAGFRLYNIVSSAFNWFVFGLQRRHFILGPLAGEGAERYRVRPAGGNGWKGRFHRRNNYARIQVCEGARGMELRVVFRRDDGVLLEETTLRLDQSPTGGAV